MTASTDPGEIESLARRIFDEYWNAGNLRNADELIADDYELQSPSLALEFQGAEGFRNSVRLFRSAFPDLEMTVQETITEGERIVVRYTLTGTHEADFMGIPPTGSQIEIDAMTIITFDGGKAVSEWRLYDVLGLMQQLGISPAPQYFDS